MLINPEISQSQSLLNKIFEAAEPEYLSRLNPAQKSAVLHKDGPMIIFAGAGSGKTRVITSRIAYLIHSGVAPWRILAMTFTNKAAAEMKHRVLELAPEARRSIISTFHSTCAGWLREFAEELGYTSDFVIYDDKDSTSLLKNILVGKFSKKDMTQVVNEQKAFIGWAKTKGLLPAEVAPYIEAHKKKAPSGGIETYRAYQQALSNANAMDFGDLLLNALLLLRRNKVVCEKLQSRYSYVMVDEFQDTNSPQFELICRLSQDHKNVVVVGDDDQSIYSWRGAVPGNIKNFRDHFKGYKEIQLGQNYRCTANIVNAAASLVKRNRTRTDKEIFTENPNGALIDYCRESDGQMEAMQIANIISHAQQDAEVKLTDFAVFYRTNSQSRQIEEALNRAKIPYTIYGALAFFERMEIRDLLAYMRVIINPKDDVALARIINVPGRGIGKTTLEKVMGTARDEGLSLMESLQLTAKQGASRSELNLSRFLGIVESLFCLKDAPLNEVLPAIERTIEYRSYLQKKFPELHTEKIENMHELGAAMAYAYELEPSIKLREWLETVSLDRDQVEERKTSGVNLMTLHMAKGLEFDQVFIAGVEENLLPHQNSLADVETLEEERRLLYVGMTRARKKLTLLNAERRLNFNKLAFNRESRFLKEIPKEFLSPKNASTISNHTFGQESFEGKGQTEYIDLYDDESFISLSPKNRVNHPTYGNGVIKSIDSEFGVERITVDFDDFGLKKVRRGHLVVISSKR